MDCRPIGHLVWRFDYSNCHLNYFIVYDMVTKWTCEHGERLFKVHYQVYWHVIWLSTIWNGEAISAKQIMHMESDHWIINSLMFICDLHGMNIYTLKWTRTFHINLPNSTWIPNSSFSNTAHFGDTSMASLLGYFMYDNLFN